MNPSHGRQRPKRSRRSIVSRLALGVLLLSTLVLALPGAASAGIIPGVHQIQNRWGGECLDVAGAASYNGAEVRIWRCVNADNQRWQKVDAGLGAVALRVAHTGKCLTIQGEIASGANIVQDVCENRPDQRWFVGAYADGYDLIWNNGLCLSKAWGDVTVWPCTGVKWQQWESLG